MRHGIIRDNARTGRAVWIDDIYDEPIGEVVARRQTDPQYLHIVPALETRDKSPGSGHPMLAAAPSLNAVWRSS